MNDSDTAPAVVDDFEVESSQPVSVSVTASPVEPVSADPGDEDPAPESDTPPEPVKKDRRSLQARIDAQTAKQREAERERDEARSRAERVERELQALRSPQQPPPTAPAGKPSAEDIGTKYQSYDEYVEALTDWKLEARDQQRAQQERQRESVQRHAQHAVTFADRIAKAEATDPEFWSRMSPDVVNLRPSGSLEPGERPTAMTAIADVIFTSEFTTELMTHFSANSREFQRLSTLPPSQLYRELGKLEASFSRPSAAPSGPAPVMPVSQAAPPIKPVGSTASAPERDPLSDDLDVDEHIRVMNARERKSARR